jgi:hypothetical protein
MTTPTNHTLLMMCSKAPGELSSCRRSLAQYITFDPFLTQHAEFSQDLKDYLDESGLEQIRHWEKMVTLLFYTLST